jgi:carbamoylphosphate synthase small subunit
MTNKKMTKRDYYNTLLALDEVKGNPTLTDFINHELELLAKKNSAEKKPTAVQVANEGIKEVILETLADSGKMMTISEMQKANEELSELSNQRISALVRQLLADGKVERIEDKRKAYFKAI